MDIVVFVKETVDKNATLSLESTFPGERGDDEISINPYDKHALEAALELKERSGEGKVTALSLGPENALKVLREAIAMGTDDAILIDNSESKVVDPFHTARILAAAVNKIGNPDLVLLGMISYDYGTAAVPPALAEILELPHSSYVEAVEFEDGKIQLEKAIEGGTRSVKLTLPAVLSIATTANEPRYTSVRRIIKASRTQVPVWNISDLETDLGTPSYQDIGLKEPEKRVAECIKFQDDSVEEMTTQLLAKLEEGGMNLGAYRK